MSPEIWTAVIGPSGNKEAIDPDGNFRSCVTYEGKIRLISCIVIADCYRRDHLVPKQRPQLFLGHRPMGACPHEDHDLFAWDVSQCLEQPGHEQMVGSRASPIGDNNGYLILRTDQVHQRWRADGVRDGGFKGLMRLNERR